MQKLGDMIGRIVVGYMLCVVAVVMTGGLFGLLPLFIGVRDFEDLAFLAVWPMLGPFGVVCALHELANKENRRNVSSVLWLLAALAFCLYMTSFIVEPLRRWLHHW